MPLAYLKGSYRVIEKSLHFFGTNSWDLNQMMYLCTKKR